MRGIKGGAELSSWKGWGGGKLSLAEALQGEGLVNGSEGCPLLFKKARIKKE